LLPLERRLLQLSSVKYIGTMTPYAPADPLIDQLFKQNEGHLLPGKTNLIGLRNLTLNGVAHHLLGEHPPYARLPLTLTVGSDQHIFHFSYSMDPAVFDKTAGDGVGYTIELRDARGKLTKVFSQYIDPKHNRADRRWMKGAIDLSAYQGQTIDLLFSTDPGPKGDPSFDWGGWANFYFDSHDLSGTFPFRNVYDHEAMIYRYENVLPRASIYFHAEMERDENAVLHRLVDPSLNVFEDVVLDASKLEKAQSAGVAALNGEAASAAVQPAVIKSYQAQSVVIEASLPRIGILVLNDSDYPGWKVEVDGRPSKWFTANYLFRGVLLTPGRHVVHFAYKPASFYLGAAISSSIFMALLLWGIVDRRKQASALRPFEALDQQL
jgi:hypothetical protein